LSINEDMPEIKNEKLKLNILIVQNTFSRILRNRVLGLWHLLGVIYW